MRSSGSDGTDADLGRVAFPLGKFISRKDERVKIPEVRFADADGLDIAWHQFGEGPDVLCIPPLVSNVELVWEHKYYRRFLEYLAGHLHVVAFDKRGIGLSARLDGIPTLEDRIEDITAVMDAAGLESATVLGTSEGGLMAQLFAALHPERVERLVLINSSPGTSGLISLLTDADGSMSRLEAQLVRFQHLQETWGRDPQFMVDWFSPVRSTDPAFVAWVGRLQRQSATPNDLANQTASLVSLDAVDHLGDISVPTLVAHARDDPVVPFAAARYLADRIPGATLVELPGNDHFLFTHPEWRTALDCCIEFITGSRPRLPASRAVTFGWDSLTPAEIRIVELAASGLSNQQIADKLFVSLPTVKTHFLHVYQKLELSSRAELITAVAARDHR
jgi:pimeloyl-ACP methyl ester carboxylesterase/DNA-binding CsgD family transcriptional regulator